tara:strand:- start:46 stop:267 length:222 start_codon:yes stop_codon:yes gene_type:complete
LYNEDDTKRLDALYKLDAIKETVIVLESLIKNNAKPEDIMRDFTKTKTSSDWIIVFAHMATWYYITQKRKEGK